MSKLYKKIFGKLSKKLSVNCELCNCLDQLAITFNKSANVEIVRSELLITLVISKHEDEIIGSKILSSDKFKTMFDFLKAKDEKIVFDELQRICVDNGWTNIGSNINRERCVHICTSLSSSSEPGNIDQIDKRIKVIRDNLLVYLRDDVELLFRYWHELGATSNDLWEKFYNINIEITDKSGNKFPKIDKFEKLFENKKFRRIVISAHAGYGKSTFVHELARQWVSGPRWSSRFKLIFLVRLGEIRKVENENFSLKDLFEKCLMKKDAEFLLNTIDQKLCSEMLLIFDGLDEMIESHVSSEVLDIILGRSTMKPFVILTTRPECLETIGGYNLYIELKGFTEIGIDEELKKFGIDNLLEKINGDILKVPLFCTLLGIIKLNSDNTDFGNLSLCQLIHKTVEYLIQRYQKVHTDFKEKSELFCTLGRSALAQLEELRIYKEGAIWFDHFEWSPTGESLRLQNFRSVAIDANLIMSNSSDTDAYFPHRMFAEYFAAYYLNAKGDLKLDNIVTAWLWYPDVIRFTNNSCCEIDNWLICFLTYFDSQLKTEIWNLLATFKEDPIVFPLFDEFDALPLIKITARHLWFPPLMSANVVSSLASKLDVPLNIHINGAQLKSAFAFSNTTEITHVTFSDCKLHVSGAEILKSFSGATAMEFKFCEMFCRKEDEDEFVCTTDFQNRTLESVEIYKCSGNVDIFLSPFRKLRKDVVRVTEREE